jgi:hypothetical protein
MNTHCGTVLRLLPLMHRLCAALETTSCAAAPTYSGDPTAGLVTFFSFMHLLLMSS